MSLDKTALFEIIGERDIRFSRCDFNFRIGWTDLYTSVNSDLLPSSNWVLGSRCPEPFGLL